MLLGSTCAKAARRMLMKLTSSINFTNILRATFLDKSVLCSFYVLTIWASNFWGMQIGAKTAHKKLVKLTIEVLIELRQNVRERSLCMEMCKKSCSFTCNIENTSKNAWNCFGKFLYCFKHFVSFQSTFKFKFLKWNFFFHFLLFPIL